MTFKDVAAVSGKPGLYKILKPTRSGVILESLDESKKKFVAGVNLRVSVLQEISVYTTDEEGIIGLPAVMKRIHEKFSDTIPVDQKSDGAELSDFLEQVVSNFDKEKVYTSDIRKLVSWYLILKAKEPEIFSSDAEEGPTVNEDATTLESKVEDAVEQQPSKPKKAPKAKSEKKSEE